MCALGRRQMDPDTEYEQPRSGIRTSGGVEGGGPLLRAHRNQHIRTQLFGKVVAVLNRYRGSLPGSEAASQSWRCTWHVGCKPFNLRTNTPPASAPHTTTWVPHQSWCVCECRLRSLRWGRWHAHDTASHHAMSPGFGGVARPAFVWLMKDMSGEEGRFGFIPPARPPRTSPPPPPWPLPLGHTELLWHLGCLCMFTCGPCPKSVVAGSVLTGAF